MDKGGWRRRRLALRLRVVICCILILSALRASGETIIWTNPEQAPWLYEENGHYTGVLYDVMMRVASSLGHEVTLRVVPMRRTFAEIAASSSHVSVVPSGEIVREDAILSGVVVCHEPIFWTYLVGFALKSRQLGRLNSDELQHYRLGRVESPIRLTGGLLAVDMATPFPDNETLVQALVSRRVDIILGAKPSLIWAFNQLEIGDEAVEVYSVPGTGFHLGWAETVNGRPSDSLRVAFEQKITEMKASGELRSIIERYLPKDSLQLQSR